MQLKHIVTESEDNTALKSILKRKLHLSTALLKRMKQTDNVLVNGLYHRFIDRVSKGDIITVQLKFGDEETTLSPQNIPVDIIYEDEAVIALNKPMSMVIHPCAGHPDGTLGNALMGYYYKTHQKIKIRPLGRLDRDTTGLVLFAKNQYVQDFLIRQMNEQEYDKKYLGIVHGWLPCPEGEIALSIARKEGSIIERTIHPEGAVSLTKYKVIRKFKDFTLAEFQIMTGRTHQIRVHCKAIGHPLLGDTLYGNIPTARINRQALHSHTVTFTHPVSGARVTLKAPLPQDMRQVLTHLEEDK